MSDDGSRVERGVRTALEALRRHWAALLVLTVLVLAVAVPWVLVADVHRSVAWEPVDTGRPAPAVMAEVTDQLREVDHRRVTRVYLVENGTRSRYAVYETVREYSRYQYVANYVRWGEKPDHASLFGDRFLVDVSVDGPVQVVQYSDDTVVGMGYRFPLDPSVLPDEPVGNYTVRLPAGVRGLARNRTHSLGPNRSLAGLYRPYFSPRGGWEVVSRNASTVVVGIDDPHAVFATVPVEATEVHPGTRVRVVLDAETGRPRRIVEHRVVSQAVNREIRRRHYLLVTRFSRWRTADATEPSWLGEGSLDSLIEDLLYY